MSGPSSSIYLSEEVKQQATEWHTLMNSGVVDDELKAQFELWLHADRSHKAAYYEIEQLWRDLDFVSIAAGVDTALEPKAGWWAQAAGRYKGLRPWPVLAPLGGALAAAGFALLFVSNLETPQELDVPAEPEYQTATAELEEVLLADGTLVTLGAKSQMNVSFSSEARQVELLSGEAFFEVAKDETRPFFVSVDDTLVRVVGTKFDVKRETDRVHVSVLEGQVAVLKGGEVTPILIEAEANDLGAKLLTAGQKIVSTDEAPLPKIETIERATPGAWRDGRLAYEDASLSEIISDVNRYSERPIRLAEASIGELRFTMGFRVSEIEDWLEVLEASQPVDVIDYGYGEIVIRERRS